ncbi:pantothenate synthetase [Granulicella rosea]|uniref:Pantothenate synthetase n=1 Tax=Granulicella rosea TaxID=474952 RepID=A0A239DSA2_9BACT|nr:pantoate--beta-alanine ligase [Granulicella rosea]SNS35370.1 pantothenate synthetase [Granulicella rosea]
MRILTTIAEARIACREARMRGELGLVPTMGALHAGHISLVRRAREDCETVAVSIFVNPLQFAANEDFGKYPRQFEQDCRMLEAAGVELLFAPTAEEMYPAGAATFVDVGELGAKLDGASRPGHFRGVATVVSKLLHVIAPDKAYFGQKDAVQVAVLARMMRDLNFEAELVRCPIVRDADCLAMSSRNAYLSAAERQQALALPRALIAMKAAIAAGERSPVRVLAEGLIVLAAEPGVAFEYLEAVDADTLERVTKIEPGTLIAVAARVGGTRLIDNMLAE